MVKSNIFYGRKTRNGDICLKTDVNRGRNEKNSVFFVQFC